VRSSLCALPSHFASQSPCASASLYHSASASLPHWAPRRIATALRIAVSQRRPELRNGQPRRFAQRHRRTASRSAAPHCAPRKSAHLRASASGRCFARHRSVLRPPTQRHRLWVRRRTHPCQDPLASLSPTIVVASRCVAAPDRLASENRKVRSSIAVRHEQGEQDPPESRRRFRQLVQRSIILAGRQDAAESRGCKRSTWAGPQSNDAKHPFTTSTTSREPDPASGAGIPVAKRDQRPHEPLD
jgi:hypothetical protein